MIFKKAFLVATGFRSRKETRVDWDAADARFLVANPHRVAVTDVKVMRLDSKIRFWNLCMEFTL